MQSEEKWLLTIFSFSQPPTPTLVLASALSQPKYLLYSKVFAKLCIVWCIYISIILGDSSLHAGVRREAQGSHTCWPSKVQQVFHSPCCKWPCTCLPPPRAGDVNPLQSPRTKAFCKFPMNLLNVGHWDTQWGSGVGCPVWTLSQFLCLAP